MLIISLIALSLVFNLDEVATSKITANPELRIISDTNERVEAEFLTQAGWGIHILSEVCANSNTVRISIKSTSGDTIIAVERPLGNSHSHLSIDSEEYLMINQTLNNGNTDISVYHIPSAYSQPVKALIQKYHNLPRLLLRRLNHETAHVEGRKVIQKFLTRAETQLIPEAALAIGSHGKHLHGINNPAAMVFYSTALRISAALQTHSQMNSLISEQKTRNRRWGGFLFDTVHKFVSPSSYEWCDNSKSECRKGDCPEGDRCRGLCGPGCTCWWIVCENCCSNLGCYWHDSEPCIGGSDSIECYLTAPVAVVC